MLAVMPDWWLVQPADAQEIAAAAAAPTARTVLWLDELQRYLGSENGLTAACVRTLVRAGVVVVGTLWPDEYATRTALRSDGMEDPHARDRELLDVARVIDVADAFTAVENRDARSAAESDLRIRAALDSSDGGLTQVLAARARGAVREDLLYRREQPVPAVVDEVAGQRGGRGIPSVVGVQVSVVLMRRVPAGVESASVRSPLHLVGRDLHVSAGS